MSAPEAERTPEPAALKHSYAVPGAAHPGLIGRACAPSAEGAHSRCLLNKDSRVGRAQEHDTEPVLRSTPCPRTSAAEPRIGHCWRALRPCGRSPATELAPGDEQLYTKAAHKNFVRVHRRSLAGGRIPRSLGSRAGRSYREAGARGQNDGLQWREEEAGEGRGRAEQEGPWLGQDLRLEQAWLALHRAAAFLRRLGQPGVRQPGRHR